MDAGQRPLHGWLQLGHCAPYNSFSSMLLYALSLLTLWQNVFERARGGEGLPLGLHSKEFACDAEDTGDAGSVPESRRSPGGGHDNPPVVLPGESPWTEELQSIGSQRVGHNWSDWAHTHRGDERKISRSDHKNSECNKHNKKAIKKLRKIFATNMTNSNKKSHF